MAQGDYIIPLGIDQEKVLEGLNKTISTLEKTKTSAKEAGQEFNKAFAMGAAEADKFDNAAKVTSKNLQEIKDAAIVVNRQLGDALNIRSASSDFAKQINQVKKKLKEVTDKQTIGLEVSDKAVKDLKDASNYLKDNFDDIRKTFDDATQILTQNVETAKENIKSTENYIKSLQETIDNTAPGMAKSEMISEINAAKEALEEEKIALDDYQNQLNEVSSANNTFTQTIRDSENAIKEFSGGQQTLRQQFLEVRREMQKLEYQGEANSEQYRELQRTAAEMSTALSNTQGKIRAASDQFGTMRGIMQGGQGLVGLFATYNGALSLMGVESEKAQEMLLKVNGAMALLQGTQAVLNALRSDSIFTVTILNRLRVKDTKDIAASAIATKANAAAQKSSTIATKASTIATRAFGVALKSIGIGLIISAIAALVTYWDDLKDVISKFLPEADKVQNVFNKIKEVAVGVGTAVLNYVTTPFKAVIKLLKGDLRGAVDEFKNGYNVIGNYEKGALRQRERNHAAHLAEMERQRIEDTERELERAKNRGEDVEQAEIELQKARVAAAKKGSKEYDEALRELEDLEDSFYKRRKNEEEARQKEQERYAKEAYKKQLELQKAQSEQIIKLTKELERQRVDAIEDSIEREIALKKLEFQDKINQLLEEELLTIEAETKRNEIVKNLREQLRDEIKQIELKQLQDRLDLHTEAHEMLMQLESGSLDNEIELLNIEHNKKLIAIENQYKDEEDLRNRLIDALIKNTEERESEIRKSYNERVLKEEEEKEKLALEIAYNYAEKSEKTEEQKEIAKLEILKKYAQKRLEFLLESGEDENSLEVLRTRKTIQDIENELKEATKQGAVKFNIFDFLGFELEDEQKAAISEAVSVMGNSMAQIADFAIKQYDRRIKKHQELIDSIGSEIDELERQLDKEKDLQEKGYANNVELIEKELEAKKDKQNREIALQEELMEKQAKIQKYQMAADTAIQFSNLATSATSIFKSLAPLGPLGIGIAIATIATMFTAFTAAKVQAMQAINQGGPTQRFERGGKIDGPSHRLGGVKYYSMDGRNIELEGEEYVINKRSYAKYADLIEAINNDTLHSYKFSDGFLADILAERGISTLSNQIASANGSAKQDVVINVASDKEELNRIIKLMQEERKTWEDDKFVYIKKGSKITKILKSN